MELRRPFPAFPRFALLVLALAVPVLAETGATDTAQSLYESGRFEKAAAALDSIAARDPEAAYLYGKVLLALGETSDGREWLEQAVAARPDDPNFHLWLGRAWAAEALDAGLLRKGLLARRSRREFEKAIELDPTHLEARLDLVRFYVYAPSIVGGGVAKAEAEASRIDEQDPTEGDVARGFIAYASQQYEAAEAHLTRASNRQPDHRRALLWLGYLYQTTHRWDDAFSAHTRLQLVPEAEMHACFEIGRTAVFSGARLDDGERCLREYLSYRPRHGEPSLAESHGYLGRTYEWRGKTAEAIRHLERALALDPNLEEAREALARQRGQEREGTGRKVRR